jgi:16S rRNA (cytidine1402-2'-O)-methyltransferase
MASTILGKLYLIPTTMGDCDPMDVLPQTIKRSIDLIDSYRERQDSSEINQNC